MKRLSWRSILQRVESKQIIGMWYGVEDGYLRLELDDGSVLVIAASWEGCHVVVDPAVLATRKGRPTKEPPCLCSRNVVGAGGQEPFAPTCYCGSETPANCNPGLLTQVLPRSFTAHHARVPSYQRGFRRSVALCARCRPS